MSELSQSLAGMDAGRPAPARIYDYLLGGTNNFQSDRDAAGRLMAAVPEIRDCAWANRGFHQRAARWMARHGIRQFIDIGSGLPTRGNTHDVVLATAPDCRVIYVDNDPMVTELTGGLLAGLAGVRVIEADLRDPDAVLAHPDLRALIDFSQPTGLLMTAVVHFVADELDPWALVARYTGALAPGSYLALSHLTSEHVPPMAASDFCRIFEHATEQIHFRSETAVERFFAGLELVPPDDQASAGRLCYAGAWGAEDPVLADSDGSRWLYCGVARRP
jgi:O-methyltransferase involved in polyketide biosynthesis